MEWRIYRSEENGDKQTELHHSEQKLAVCKHGQHLLIGTHNTTKTGLYSSVSLSRQSANTSRFTEARHTRNSR